MIRVPENRFESLRFRQIADSSENRPEKFGFVMRCMNKFGRKKKLKWFLMRFYLWLSGERLLTSRAGTFLAKPLSSSLLKLSATLVLGIFLSHLLDYAAIIHMQA